ncbi:MAG: peptide MFS transporter [Myxococcales bacterium]|nr:peptide MFS transporter [Myxococcales bacterium]
MSRAKQASHTPSGQPPGLYVLFFAEAWERFSYYGMRALLVLYMVKHLKYERSDALQIYATYTGLVYLTPMIGGYLADRFLGARKAVLIGGIVMALGHLAMAFEPLLYAALSLLIIGNGFFKPNISTIVGGLYEEHDPRRDGGFTIFYMGINLGAFFSPLVCGTLGQNTFSFKVFGYAMTFGGWHWGFGAAGIGMVVGLLVFMAGQKLLGTTGFPPYIKNPTKDTRLTAKDWRDVWIMVIASCLVVAATLPLWNPMSTTVKLLFGVVLLAVFYFGWTDEPVKVKKPGDDENPPLNKQEWERILYIIVLCAPVLIFWMGFEQAGGTFNLFAEENTNRVVYMGWLHSTFGIAYFKAHPYWNIPASYFQSINPLLIMLLAPVFAMLWFNLNRSKNPPSTTTKMAFGVLFLGLGFIVMFLGTVATVKGKVSPMWLVAVYFLHTVGELCLSPVGLSMVTKVAPLRIVSLMMGLWFASTALANYLAGSLENLLKKDAIARALDQLTHQLLNNMGVSGLSHKMVDFARVCVFVTILSVASFIIVMAVRKSIDRLSHGRD